MASTKDEITAIAIEHGYTGKKPDSIAKAIDALADTLAGEDVTGSRSISGAVKALAPYIGTGGGGGSVIVTGELDEQSEVFTVTSHTAGEMMDAVSAGKMLVVYDESSDSETSSRTYDFIMSASMTTEGDNSTYTFDAMNFSLQAESADSYPSTQP